MESEELHANRPEEASGGHAGGPSWWMPFGGNLDRAGGVPDDRFPAVCNTSFGAPFFFGAGRRAGMGGWPGVAIWPLI